MPEEYNRIVKIYKQGHIHRSDFNKLMNDLRKEGVITDDEFEKIVENIDINKNGPIGADEFGCIESRYGAATILFDLLVFAGWLTVIVGIFVIFFGPSLLPGTELREIRSLLGGQQIQDFLNTAIRASGVFIVIVGFITVAMAQLSLAVIDTADCNREIFLLLKSFTRKCPHCGGEQEVKATTCLYCHHELPPAEWKKTTRQPSKPASV